MYLHPYIFNMIHASSHHSTTLPYQVYTGRSVFKFICLLLPVHILLPLSNAMPQCLKYKLHGQWDAYVTGTTLLCGPCVLRPFLNYYVIYFHFPKCKPLTIGTQMKCSHGALLSVLASRSPGVKLYNVYVCFYQSTITYIYQVSLFSTMPSAMIQMIIMIITIMIFVMVIAIMMILTPIMITIVIVITTNITKKW